uniref:Uncharacterized protein n=1 Tax=Avena sativa TaxID=4498 RepID=A0ACD5W8S6_AVESA
MPIAAKLFYFQRRRPSPVEPTDDSLRGDSPATARRQVHPSRSAHHRPGYEVARGSQRDCGASSKSITEPTRDMLFSSRLSTNTSNDRLPDAVQQAKERLHQRLRSADLFPGRRQAAPAAGTIWAGPHLSSESDVCKSKDCRLDGPTLCFNSTASFPTHKVKQTTAEPCSGVAGVAPPRPRPVSKLGQETLQVTIEGEDVESSVDCSICLEGCHSAAGGLVQLRCKHIFHSACLEQWLQSRADCPYCRASVVLPLEE